MKASILFASLLATGSYAASAAGSHEKPLVESSRLRRALTRTGLLKHALKLEYFARTSPGDNRAFGTKGHNNTVSYIKAQLDKTGYYDTEIQTFRHPFSDGTANFTAAGTAYETEWFTYSPAGTAEGLVVPVAANGCVSDDYPADVSGNIAFILRGECEFGLKIALAGAAGASGAVIYNNVPAPVNGGTLGAPERPEVGPYVPSSSISGADGQAILERIAAGEEVTGKVVVDATNEWRWTSNLLATSKNGDRKNIVFSGAHTDSVTAGAGINDNGSGTIGLLEVALALTKYKVKNAVKFGWWTAEEYGLVGSEHYVQSMTEQERKDVALYLNFDMIASPNYGMFVYDGDGSAFNLTGPKGSDHIEHSFEDYFKSVGIKSAPTAFDGRSDYGPFLDVGIPAGGLFTGAEVEKTAEQVEWWGGEAGVAYDKNYHRVGDDITNLAWGAWIQNTKAAAHVIAQYARDLAGIPREREAVARVAVQATPRKPHGACNHVFHEI